MSASICHNCRKVGTGHFSWCEHHPKHKKDTDMPVFDLGQEWWQRVAIMDRTELVDALRDEAEKRGVLTREYENRKKELETSESQLSEQRAQRRETERVLLTRWVVAGTLNQAMYAANRMKIEDRHRRYILTNIRSDYRIRGHSINPSNVFLVRGWTKGEYTDKIIEAFAPTGVDLKRCAYAADPHIDMLESGEYKAAVLKEYAPISELAPGSQVRLKNMGAEGLTMHVTGATVSVAGKGSFEASVQLTSSPAPPSIYRDLFNPKDFG